MQNIWDRMIHPNGLTYVNPFLLKNMEKALDRMVKAINEREKIVIYGCSDVDGICAVSVLLLVLKYLNADVEYYISDSIHADDKISIEAVKNHIRFLGASLIITVGCNFESEEQQDFFKEIGLDFIITDNKESFIKNDFININPHNENCEYKFKELSISGLVFKLTQAISTYYNMKSISKYIDIVMIGTYASGMPLLEENEVIFKEGIKFLPNTNNYGLRALMKLKEFTTIKTKEINEIVKIITPTINAIGRMDNARIAVELLTTNMDYRAEQIAKYLIKEVNL